MRRTFIQPTRKKVLSATAGALAKQRRQRAGVTLSAPISFPAIPLSTYSTPSTPGIDLQVQLQLSVQLVPSPSVTAPQATTSAEVVQAALANWILENPGQAFLYGAGAVLFISWLDSFSRPARRARRLT
jgi:hypothetical protein